MVRKVTLQDTSNEVKKLKEKLRKAEKRQETMLQKRSVSIVKMVAKMSNLDPIEDIDTISELIENLLLKNRKEKKEVPEDEGAQYDDAPYDEGANVPEEEGTNVPLSSDLSSDNYSLYGQ